MNKQTQQLLGKALSYARFAIAGGIGGVALYNTYLIIAAAAPAYNLESISMALGAVVTTAAVKLLHVV